MVKAGCAAFEERVMDYGTDRILPPEPKERRRPGRITSAGATCRLGEVVDISARGVRIRHKGFGWYTAGVVVNLTLETEDVSVSVRAAIRWIKKIRIGVYDIGLEFVGLTPEELQAVWGLAFSSNRFVSGTQLKYVRHPR